MENRIEKIQDMLMKEMERLENEFIDKNEIARCNALSDSATAFIKTVNVGFRVIEMSEKTQKNIDSINKQLGITNEK